MKIKRLLSCGASVLLTGTFVIGGSVLPIVLADYFIQGDDTKTVSADIDGSFLVENNVADDITTTVWYDYSNTATSKATTTTGTSNRYLYTNTSQATTMSILPTNHDSNGNIIGVYDGFIQYTQYTDHVEITGSNKSYNGEVIIPERINNLPVTMIGDNVFSNSNLTSVVIPSNVTKIGTYAFWACKSLKEVIFSSNIESIDIFAFGYCSELEKINLPSSIKVIGMMAFEGCNKLREITIPFGVERIGREAFRGCSKLHEVILPLTVNSIGEMAFYGILNKLVVENPNCIFYPDWNVVGSSCTIYGYPDSTAEKYATDYGYKFADINLLADEIDIGTDVTAYTPETTTTTTTTTVAETEFAYGDINKDGKIDAADASDILSYYAYMSTKGSGTLEEYLSK